MLENSERYPLQNIVVDDLFSANKLVVALLIAIVMTAVTTVWVTHKTRTLTSEKGELVFEKQALENEYLNLKLEETTQSDNTRIEAIATVKLGMKHIDSEHEVVILE
ncbi:MULTISPECIES: cell division protein FtsL [Basfia]|uniref:Cell division protein FtsL n=2 Tax=Basfia TaxID=697331 RepID=Q65RX9_MANSM|nr:MULTISPECIES: cell division protein FtsL [Basfia]AAU38281.1 FtsL protein [[Mannheimia] succiniciproducens MBEL55E]QIM68918.1 cell division protein FtsL [Basfia succiniciproducens]SCY01675.1 cell division protein FtsL [Basfia succiniciproducens]SEQ36006.1 cell division protein FtsL [Basfia succiniciproducens]